MDAAPHFPRSSGRRWLSLKNPLIVRLICCVFLASLPGYTLAENVAILLSGQGTTYTDAAEAIQIELRKDPSIRTIVMTVGTVGTVGNQSWQELTGSSPQLLIAVGTRATEYVLKQGDSRVPVLNLLVPRSTYESLVASARTTGVRRVSAVFLDQPITRNLELIRQALPSLKRVGTVAGPESSREIERLQTLSPARGIELISERAGKETELFPMLQRVMSEAEVFLAIPDAVVVNSDTAQNLLLTSYRFRIPVIGFSAAYVRAGALAAVYSTPQQAGTEGGEIARFVLRGNPLPAPRYPRLFSVGVNRSVAASLGLTLPDDLFLKERIQERIQRGETD